MMNTTCAPFFACLAYGKIGTADCPLVFDFVGPSGLAGDPPARCANVIFLGILTG
jgi:hypothetical protein